MNDNNYDNQFFSTSTSGENSPLPQANGTQSGYQQPGQPQFGFNGQQVPYPPINSYNPAAKSKLAAGLLGIFLGWLGIHNFYLGYVGKAVAQLLISLLSFGFLAFISGIWGFIEGIMILTSRPGSRWNQDAQGIPLRD